MRISDWSSDVCSSDLREKQRRGEAGDVVAAVAVLAGDEVAEVGIDEGDGGEDDQRPAERQAHEHHRRYTQRQKYDLVRFSGDGAAQDDVVEEDRKSVV